MECLCAFLLLNFQTYVSFSPLRINNVLVDANQMFELPPKKIYVLVTISKVLLVKSMEQLSDIPPTRVKLHSCSY